MNKNKNSRRRIKAFITRLIPKSSSWYKVLPPHTGKKFYSEQQMKVGFGSGTAVLKLRLSQRVCKSNVLQFA
jgi:hypothetical protein